MEYVTIKVPAVMARDILRFMEARVKAMEEEVADLRAQTEQVRTLAVQTPPGKAKIERYPSGRAPRGASRGVIIKFLQEHSGEEISINDIVGMTGVSEGTAYRILNKLWADGEVTHEKGLWKSTFPELAEAKGNL